MASVLTGIGLAFLGGLAGSAHCAGMCGGFSLAVTGPRGDRRARLALFHGARVNAYVGFGACAGGLGAGWLAAGPVAVMGRILAIVAGSLMVWVGLEVLGLVAPVATGALRSVHDLLGRLLAATVQTPSAATPLALGVLNAFLPCHLVLAAVAVAAGTGSVLGGAATMLAFGLGTVPALMAVGGLGGALSPILIGRARGLAAVLFVGCGVVTVARAFMLLCAHYV